MHLNPFQEMCKEIWPVGEYQQVIGEYGHWNMPSQVKSKFDWIRIGVGAGSNSRGINLLIHRMVGTAPEMPKKVSEMVLIYRFFFPNCPIKGLDEKWFVLEDIICPVMYGRFDIDNMSLEDLEKVMDECADNVVNGTEEERLGANHNTPAHSVYLCRLQKKG